MSYRDRSSTDSWIDFMEYETSRGGLGGGGGSLFSGGSSGGGHEDRDKMLAEMVLGGESDPCQMAIEQYDWAKSVDDERKAEPSISGDDWQWMIDCYERAQAYRREYGAVLFDTGSIFDWHLTEMQARADQGEAASQLRMGELLYYCVKPPYGWRKAMKWISRAASQGNKEAQCFYGKCYYEGTGPKQSESSALVWWKKASAQGCRESQVRLAYHAFVRGNRIKAFKAFVQAAEQGDAMAQAWAGVCCEHGLGTKTDHEKAAEWLRRAAEGGLIEAQRWMELYGDTEHAERWLCKAKMQAVSDNAKHCRRASRRESVRKLIADVAVRHVREEASEEELERLGKRGKASAWGCLIAIALVIGGCHTMF